MKRILMAGTMLVTACSAPTQPYLDHARANCNDLAQTDLDRRTACEAIPHLQAQVSAEHNEQAGKVAAGILLGILTIGVAAAAGYSAAHSPPTEIVVVCRPWWSC